MNENEASKHAIAWDEVLVLAYLAVVVLPPLVAGITMMLGGIGGKMVTPWSLLGYAMAVAVAGIGLAARIEYRITKTAPVKSSRRSATRGTRWGQA